LLVILTGLLVLLPGLNTLPLIDRDEPRFAQAAREMAERQDWIIPTFNGAYRFDKPPLIYWLMRAGYAVAGVCEAAARWQSVLSAVGVGLLILAMGRRWHSLKAGLLGALAWLTSFQVFIHGRLSLADMPMVFFVTMSSWALYELLTVPQDKRYGRWFWLFYLSLGFGFLAKGPVCLVMPLLTVVIWKWIFRCPTEPVRTLNLLPGLLLVLLVMGFWGVPALLVTHGAYWRVGIGEHVVHRGAESFNGRVTLPFYYLLTVWLSLFPWSLTLPAWVAELKRRWDSKIAFGVAWFAAPFFIFTFYATQLPHYLLPGFPAFFLLFGMAAAEFDVTRRGWKTFTVCFHVLALALTLLGAGLLLIRPGAVYDVSGGWDFWAACAVRWQGAYPLSELTGFIGAVLMILGGLAYFPLALGGKRLYAVCGIMILVFAATILGREARKISAVLNAVKVAENPAVDYLGVGMGFQEPGLVFYTNKTWEFASNQKSLDELPTVKPVLLVVARKEYLLGDLFSKKHPGGRIFREYEQMPTGPRWVKLGATAGLNFARAGWVELDVYRRAPERAPEPKAMPNAIPNAAPTKTSLGK